MNLIRRLNQIKYGHVIILCCLLCLLSLVFGCKSTPLKKTEHKSKTGFTIPANSVLSFEKGTLTVNNDVPVQHESLTASEQVDLNGIQAQANANVISKFYMYGGILAIIGAFLLWRGHVKAGFIAMGGAIGCPLLARFYSSEAAQNIALAALCIAGALFFAWHMVKKNLRQA